MKRLFHKYIWPRIPQVARRSMLFYAMSNLAPKPSSDCGATFPIIVAGALRTTSGLGQSARLAYEALNSVGLPVYGIDLTDALLQPADCSEFQFSDGRSYSGPATIMLHVNSPLVPLAMYSLGRSVVNDRRIVGYWAWELSSVPNDWNYGVPFVHEVWVPSAFVASSVAKVVDQQKVLVLPHPVAGKKTNSRRLKSRERNDVFTVLMVFNAASSIDRKNPDAVIAAFKEAFGDDQSVRLIIKASNLDRFPNEWNALQSRVCGAENIELISEVRTFQEMQKLYATADALISLHRSEGFGLVLAEAMLHGLPVIATNWSGNIDFMNHENSCPVSYELISASDAQKTYHFPELMWADASVADAAMKLKYLRDNRDVARRIGEVASDYALHEWNFERYADKVCSLIGAGSRQNAG